MRADWIRRAAVGAAMVLTLTGCGPGDPGAPEQDRGGASADDSSSGDEPRLAREQITPGGIAALVLEHLGSDAVQEFVTFEPEPGAVSVSVRLREATPHNFGVQVYSPKEAEMFGAAGQCPGEPQSEPASQCRTLDNGTTVTTRLEAEGFSDDNEDGMVVSGTAVTPEDGAALAMYESYDDSPAVSVDDLADLLTDPRLTWLTDPAVNEAGKAIDVKRMD